MDERNKLLVLATIDELLVEEFGVTDLLTSEQSDKFLARIDEVYDTSSPQELRETLIEAGRKFYEELFGGEDVE